MFIRAKKTIGLLFVLFGIVSLLGMAGADDVTVLGGNHTALLPLILKGLLFLGMMGTGAILLGGEAE